MADRLSDEQVNHALEAALQMGGAHDVDECTIVAMAREIQERRHLDPLRASEIAELIERRKADLSADEVTDLRALRNAARVLLWTWDGTGEDPRDAIRRAFTVLDRLTGAKP